MKDKGSYTVVCSTGLLNVIQREKRIERDVFRKQCLQDGMCHLYFFILVCVHKILIFSDYTDNGLALCLPHPVQVRSQL